MADDASHGASAAAAEDIFGQLLDDDNKVKAQQADQRAALAARWRSLEAARNAGGDPSAAMLRSVMTRVLAGGAAGEAQGEAPAQVGQAHAEAAMAAAAAAATAAAGAAAAAEEGNGGNLDGLMARWKETRAALDDVENKEGEIVWQRFQREHRDGLRKKVLEKEERERDTAVVAASAPTACLLEIVQERGTLAAAAAAAEREHGGVAVAAAGSVLAQAIAEAAAADGRDEVRQMFSAQDRATRRAAVEAAGAPDAEFGAESVAVTAYSVLMEAQDAVAGATNVLKQQRLAAIFHEVAMGGHDEAAGPAAADRDEFVWGFGEGIRARAALEIERAKLLAFEPLVHRAVVAAMEGNDSIEADSAAAELVARLQGEAAEAHQRVEFLLSELARLNASNEDRAAQLRDAEVRAARALAGINADGGGDVEGAEDELHRLLAGAEGSNRLGASDRVLLRHVLTRIAHPRGTVIPMLAAVADHVSSPGGVVVAWRATVVSLSCRRPHCFCRCRRPRHPRPQKQPRRSPLPLPSPPNAPPPSPPPSSSTLRSLGGSSTRPWPSCCSWKGGQKSKSAVASSAPSSPLASCTGRSMR